MSQQPEPMHWAPPIDVADAPDEVPGGYRYVQEGDSFYTGEIPITLLEAAWHAKDGERVATSLRAMIGAPAPGGNGVRWDEYLGLDFSKDFNKAQHKAFFNAFCPGYIGSEAHRRGDPVDIAQLAGRWALAVVRAERDSYEGRSRLRPRVVRFVRFLTQPIPVPESTKVVDTSPPTATPRAAAPGARPATGAPGARPGPAPAGGPVARPAAGSLPARPQTPPVPQQQSFIPQPPAQSREDEDLPF